MKHSALLRVDEAQNAHDIRTELRFLLEILDRSEVQNALNERIYFLLNRTLDPNEKRNLEDIQDEIEEEIRTRSKLDEKRARQEIVMNEKLQLQTALNPRVPSFKKNIIEDFEKGSLIRNIDFDETGGNLLEKAEWELIQKVYLFSDFNKAETARILGCSLRKIRDVFNKKRNLQEAA